MIFFSFLHLVAMDVHRSGRSATGRDEPVVPPPVHQVMLEQLVDLMLFFEPDLRACEWVNLSSADSVWHELLGFAGLAFREGMDRFDRELLARFADAVGFHGCRFDGEGLAEFLMVLSDRVKDEGLPETFNQIQTFHLLQELADFLKMSALVGLAKFFEPDLQECGCVDFSDTASLWHELLSFMGIMFREGGDRFDQAYLLRFADAVGFPGDRHDRAGLAQFLIELGERLHAERLPANVNQGQTISLLQELADVFQSCTSLADE